MDKNSEGVEISAKILGRTLTGFQPPVLGAAEDGTRDRKIRARPKPKPMPNLLSETAMHKEVGAAFMFC